MTMMLLSLTSSSSATTVEEAPVAKTNPKVVGGKAASLAKLYTIAELKANVPISYALTVDFFEPWIMILRNEYPRDEDNCAQLQKRCQTLPLNDEQQTTLDTLSEKIKTSFGLGGLAAVRSSAPEEDGQTKSFAGAFETKLGVTADELEEAVRDCFASRFDSRVLSYVASGSDKSNSKKSLLLHDNVSFAVVVMEMVDADTAGVAFSANPLNSDRDELVIDSSYGLGESVVDGSVTADRYVYDKVQKKIIQTLIGAKSHQKKLDQGGGVVSINIPTEKQSASSLADGQLKELADLVCIIEGAYGFPVDVEFAYTKQHLTFLQVRPITTLFYIDENMMTQPGEKRVLYYDANVVSDATTTNPFTRMDMDFYCWATTAMMGIPDRDMYHRDPNMPIFKASTRLYVNLSIFLKFISTEYCAKAAEMADPYLSSLFASKDCDRNTYKMRRLPKGVNFCNGWKLIRQFPFMKLSKIASVAKKDPVKAKSQYEEILQQDIANLKALEERGPKLPEEGLQSYARELYQAIWPSFEQELGILFFAVLPLFQELDKGRREGETEELREEYGHLCGGYEGDELMQMNIDIYQLANLLPKQIWQDYRHEDLDKFATRIQDNLDKKITDDLPSDFLEGWKGFMDRHGWDGEDQWFPSSPRYEDSPVLLLAKLRQNVAGDGVTNPSDVQRKQVQKRHEVMALQEQRAKEKKWYQFSGLSKIQSRNAIMDNLMWIRNGPKLHLAQLCGIIRANVLRVEEDFLRSGRLETKGDIFHINLDEIDQALREESLNLMELIRPRKIVYERALRVVECPILVDSRCRILKPDPPEQGENHEDGTLIGAPISPGVATGRVRIMHSPSEKFEKGEILAAVVTSPAWTPLFVGASAVVLQVGGALQHGALCAREFGKPAVSNIDIHSLLKTGMMVEVDGNTGTVRILEDDTISETLSA